MKRNLEVLRVLDLEPFPARPRPPAKTEKIKPLAANTPGQGGHQPRRRSSRVPQGRGRTGTGTDGGVNVLQAPPLEGPQWQPEQPPNDTHGFDRLLAGKRGRSSQTARVLGFAGCGASDSSSDPEGGGERSAGDSPKVLKFQSLRTRVRGWGRRQALDKVPPRERRASKAAPASSAESEGESAESDMESNGGGSDQGKAQQPGRRPRHTHSSLVAESDGQARPWWEHRRRSPESW